MLINDTGFCAYGRLWYLRTLMFPYSEYVKAEYAKHVRGCPDCHYQTNHKKDDMQ